MKYIKKFNEDIYLEPDTRYSYRKKITDEQVECLERQINSDYAEKLNIKEWYSISSIEWFNWDNEEKWFVFLVNDAQLEKILLKKRIKIKGENYEVKTRRGYEKFKDILTRLESLSRYKEVIIKRPNFVDIDKLYVDEKDIDLSDHGSPAVSNTLWTHVYLD
jgi:hypothetical protein